jgi:hypothetical protein
MLTYSTLTRFKMEPTNERVTGTRNGVYRLTLRSGQALESMSTFEVDIPNDLILPA